MSAEKIQQAVDQYTSVPGVQTPVGKVVDPSFLKEYVSGSLSDMLTKVVTDISTKHGCRSVWNSYSAIQKQIIKHQDYIEKHGEHVEGTTASGKPKQPGKELPARRAMLELYQEFDTLFVNRMSPWLHIYLQNQSQKMQTAPTGEETGTNDDVTKPPKKRRRSVKKPAEAENSEN